MICNHEAEGGCEKGLGIIDKMVTLPDGTLIHAKCPFCKGCGSTCSYCGFPDADCICPDEDRDPPPRPYDPRRDSHY